MNGTYTEASKQETIAWNLAHKAHRGQTFMCFVESMSIPYMQHIVDTFRRLPQNADETVRVVAILHDSMTPRARFPLTWGDLYTAGIQTDSIELLKKIVSIDKLEKYKDNADVLTILTADFLSVLSFKSVEEVNVTLTLHPMKGE